jgi:hypothetical protein
VEVERGVDLRGKDPVDLLRSECGEETVVEHPRRVHHRGQRMPPVDPGEQLGDLRTVADIAGRDRHLATETGQPRDQFGHSGGVHPAPAGQEQVPKPVRGHQVPGDRRADTRGATGHQHGAGGIEARRLGNLLLTDDARGERVALSERDLRFVGVPCEHAR